MAAFLILTALAAALARRAARLSPRGQGRVTAALAVFFPLSEVLKQLLLYWSRGGSYSWWHFPFQLCSMPLYLLPLWHLLPPRWKRTRQALATFLVDFGLLGGLFVFADQSGMHYALPVLTLHSYLWHFLMIFLGLFFCFTRQNSSAPRDFLLPGALFLLLTGAATGINAAFHTRGEINMFYLSPYLPMTQVVFGAIAQAAGQTAGRLSYFGALLLGGFLIHVCTGFFHRRRD